MCEVDQLGAVRLRDPANLLIAGSMDAHLQAIVTVLSLINPAVPGIQFGLQGFRSFMGEGG